MDVTVVLVGAVLFLAAFTQSLSGFGVALVSMALLPGLLGIQTSTALVALVSVVVDLAVLLRYRESLDLRAIKPVVLASIVGVPVGVFLLRRLDERVTLSVLGAVLAGYALYALVGFRLPELTGRVWAYAAGFLGGVLGGAYNTSGPPVIIYASCRRWPPKIFKSNLQGFFLLNSIVVLISHAVGGSFTPAVWQLFRFGLPPIALGLLAGMSLDRWLNPLTFRRVVQVLLIVMGLRMVF